MKINRLRVLTAGDWVERCHWLKLRKRWHDV